MDAVDIRKITGHELHNKAARRMHNVSVQMVLCAFFQICLYKCVQGQKRESCFPFKTNKALCCFHRLLSGCPYIPLWIQGSCFVVVIGLVLGKLVLFLKKACFFQFPTQCFGSSSLFSSSVLISQISLE